MEVQRATNSALFDSYVMVDWSASSRRRQGRDSIWVAVVHAHHPDRTVLDNPATRQEARRLLESTLIGEVRAGRRVLVGFDFPFGYPAGFGAPLGFGGEAAWRAIWRHLASQITDGPSNANNRFDVAADLNARCGGRCGPFWGCPPSRAASALTVRRLCSFPFSDGDGLPLGEYRLTEQRLRDRRLRVQSAWKLMGAGSVGSQALTGIPVVEALRDHARLASVSQVWPFETGLSVHHGTGARIVHAEIWPGAVPLNPALHPVRDAAQVLTLARHLAGLDRAGTLAQWFAPRLDTEQTGIVIREEGWILGS